MEGDAYTNRGYAEEERAFIIEGWGDADVRLEINGKRRPRGRDFRYGFRHTLQGSDLIVWIKYRSTDPVGLRLTPVKSNCPN